MRLDGRALDEMREISFKLNYVDRPFGSVLISMGKTKVICCATINESIPRFLRGSGKGWLSAEYSLLPCSTQERVDREAIKGKQKGRTIEIQRLIGRSLRSCLDLEALGERTIKIDCDVIQADGGTRSAAITGAFVALQLSIDKMIKNKILKVNPIKNNIGAISVGIVDDEIMLDLSYEEDSRAMVDMNIVINSSNEIIEIQGSSETKPFSIEKLNKMLNMSNFGIMKLVEEQKKIL